MHEEAEKMNGVEASDMHWGTERENTSMLKQRRWETVKFVVSEESEKSEGEDVQRFQCPLDTENGDMCSASAASRVGLLAHARVRHSMENITASLVVTEVSQHVRHS